MEKDTSWKCEFQKKKLAMLISSKVDFRTKTTTKDRKERYVMIKGSIYNIFPLPFAISIDKQHNLFEPQFLHLWNGDNKHFIKYYED